MKRILIAALALACCLWAGGPALAFQGKGGQVVRKKPAEETPPKVLATPDASRPERPTGSRRAKPTRPKVAARVCRPVNLTVRCGLPGCGVLLEGQAPQVLADQRGEAVVAVPSEKRLTLVVTKKGYETAKVPVLVDCGEEKVVPVTLKALDVSLRIRTSPPESEVFINGNRQGRSNARGEFIHSTALPSLLIEVQKKGYLSANRRVTDVNAEAAREIGIALQPIPVTVLISTTADGAVVRVGERLETRPAAEKILLPPGQQTLAVEALGYARHTFEVDLTPGTMHMRVVALQRLPLAALKEQAEQLYRARAYAEVLKLCGYMFEAEPNYPAAHRLAGLTYVLQQDFAKAEPHLAKALAGNEAVELRVRRHARENFHPARGHDACQGVLVLTKTEVEFRGLQYGAENFKVPYAKVQQLGLKLKGGVALYLETKVTDAGNRRRDYNFYNGDHEVSQAGRPYLEMIQRLLRAH